MTKIITTLIMILMTIKIIMQTMILVMIKENNNCPSNTIDGTFTRIEKYENHYFGIDKSLSDNDINNLNFVHQKINTLIKDINEKNESFDFSNELFKALSKVNKVFFINKSNH